MKMIRPGSCGWWSLRVLLLSSLIILMGASPIQASSSARNDSIQASGGFSLNAGDVSPVGTPQFSGLNVIVQETGKFTLTGTLQMSCSEEGHATIHIIGQFATFQGRATCTGTLNGASGTLTFNIVGKGDSSGSFSGLLTILKGTGDLSRTKGNLRVQGTASMAGLFGDYQGELHEKIPNI